MERIVYTTKEACDLLRISESTLRRRIKDGTIPREVWCGKVLIPAWFFENIKNGKQATKK